MAVESGQEMSPHTIIARSTAVDGEGPGDRAQPPHFSHPAAGGGGRGGDGENAARLLTSGGGGAIFRGASDG